MSSTPRTRAFEALKGKQPLTVPGFDISKKPADVWEEDVFGEKQLRQKLPPSAYKSFMQSLSAGTPLDPQVADQIAAAMKEWALSRGATHFTHWFQPLNGHTAEKHDSFIGFTGSTYNRSLMMLFTGKQLIQGEPDASSFPSGGIRSTFEARGYTAWDMSSPAYIRHCANGNFLAIPTAFCSWTGEALDLKTPLLRSEQAVSRATIRVLNLIDPNNQATSASSSLGSEQEFFVIDQGFYEARPDLQACGRTLLGRAPPKGQELEDHYFGSMDRRVMAMLQDVEWNCWRLGIPVTTRHNEVAPSQYEIAPVYEPVSVACDHNMIQMELLVERARVHGLAVLLHEKPFKGVNGSGKHNNWSIGTNTGENMFEPGSTPENNTRFLVFLAAVVRAISLHGDVLRCAIAVPGNDHRLGANEAPPAIISAYVGDLLEKVIEDIINESTTKSVKKVASSMVFGVPSLPKIVRDQSDRNRTSPFAFTGNKFEFRAVGSSQACARPITFINTVVADSLEYIADQIEKLLKLNMSREIAVQSVVTQVLKEHQRAVFNGNGYSSEWVAEAEKRGLFNLRTMVDAANQLTSEKNIKLFESQKVYSKVELQSQANVMFESYIKAIDIEAKCMENMISTMILPACLDHRAKVAASINPKSAGQAKVLEQVDAGIDKMIASLDKLREVHHQAHQFDESKLFEHASFFKDHVIKAMEELREISDHMEGIVDDKLWPLPKYGEILFLK